MRNFYIPLAIIVGLFVGACMQAQLDTRVTTETTFRVPSERLEAQRRRIFRKQQQDQTPRTTPYVDPNPPEAPILLDESVGGEAPIFEFANPAVTEDDVADDLVDVPEVTPGGPDDTVTDQVQGVFQSISKLFSGEGSMTDIISIVTVVLALFGGGTTFGSDGFFKLILGLFSGKANFKTILKERVADEGKPRRRRRK